MPWIKILKPGKMATWHGKDAYQWVEVDEMGNPTGASPMDQSPSQQQNKSFSWLNGKKKEQSQNMPRTRPLGKTEKKIAPGIRAPDTQKGYTKPFDYHLWNKLRKEGRVR